MREVLERPELRLVPHIGYVSLFPFMGKLIPPVSYSDNLFSITLFDPLIRVYYFLLCRTVILRFSLFYFTFLCVFVLGASCVHYVW